MKNQQDLVKTDQKTPELFTISLIRCALWEKVKPLLTVDADTVHWATMTFEGDIPKDKPSFKAVSDEAVKVNVVLTRKDYKWGEDNTVFEGEIDFMYSDVFNSRDVLNDTVGANLIYLVQGHKEQAKGESGGFQAHVQECYEAMEQNLKAFA